MYCDDIVTVRDLSKKYGHKTVLRGLNLHLKQGEVVLLLGQNGAGKTTTVNCILGQTSYNGQITIMGNRPNSLDAKRLIGYVPEIPIPSACNALAISSALFLPRLRVVGIPSPPTLTILLIVCRLAIIRWLCPLV